MNTKHIAALHDMHGDALANLDRARSLDEFQKAADAWEQALDAAVTALKGQAPETFNPDLVRALLLEISRTKFGAGWESLLAAAHALAESERRVVAEPGEG